MSNYLLDTHILLWVISEPSRLSAKVQAIIEDTNNELYYSAMSIMEIGIKTSLGKLDIDPHLVHELLSQAGYTEMPLHCNSALEMNKLPAIHKDPFDRALIAQAVTSGSIFITADSEIAKYTNAQGFRLYLN